MQYYFKTSDDNEYGPIDEGKIRAWLEQGRMNQDSLVRAIDSEEWQPLNDYPELMALLAPSSSAPPSPTPPPTRQLPHPRLAQGGVEAPAARPQGHAVPPAVGAGARGGRGTCAVQQAVECVEALLDHLGRQPLLHEYEA